LFDPDVVDICIEAFNLALGSSIDNKVCIPELKV